MEVLSMLLGYLPMILVIVILIGGAVAMFINSKRGLSDWLILAVTECEKTLGGGVGALKLRTCYEKFLELYPVLSKLISFEKFSELVDKALVEMKKMLENNKKVQEYVNGDKETE